MLSFPTSTVFERRIPKQKFYQNLDVTAVFGAASVHITSEGKGAVGSSYTFKANLSGKYAKAEHLRWYANGQEVTQAAGKSTITVVVDSSMVNASYKIHAVVTYNDCKVSSNTLTITIGSGVSSESAPASSSSSSACKWPRISVRASMALWRVPGL